MSTIIVLECEMGFGQLEDRERLGTTRFLYDEKLTVLHIPGSDAVHLAVTVKRNNLPAQLGTVPPFTDQLFLNRGIIRQGTRDQQ